MRVRAAVIATTMLLTGVSVASGSASAEASPTPTATHVTPAAAAPPDLYVDSGRCSTAPPDGSYGAPFCTVSAAVAVVVPGQTVDLTGPSLREHVVITRSGTPGAPITLRGGTGPDQYATLNGSTSPTDTQPAITISGAHDVVLQGLNVYSVGGDGVLIDNSSSVVVNGGLAYSQRGHAVHVTGPSSDITISREILRGNATTPVTIDSGATGTTITTDDVMPGGGIAAVVATDAPGTVIAHNTVDDSCGQGVVLAGTSTGSSVLNNVIETGLGSAAVRSACTVSWLQAHHVVGIMLAATAESGSTVDGNVIDPISGGSLYTWGATDYADVASFIAGTGQGHHDLAANPSLSAPFGSDPFSLVGWGTQAAPNPIIDSAVAGPGELTTDFFGNARADDPDVINGSPTYADRGAFEDPGPLNDGPFSEARHASSGPFDAIATGYLTSAWTTSGPIGVLRVSFGDGTPNATTTDQSLVHTYQRAGLMCISLFVSDNALRGVTGSGTSGCIMFGASYTALAPTRILDTRNAIGVSTTTPVAPGADLQLSVPSIAGVSTTGLSALALNVTVNGATKSGHLDLNANGTSTLNFAAGQTVANMAIVAAPNGALDFHNGSAGTVHVVADLEGYYGATGDAYAATTPARVLDTRAAIGVPGKTPVAPRGTVTLDLSGRLPVGATAAVLTLTATQPTASGYLTAYPDGQTAPTASAVNFPKGKSVANSVVVPVVNGKVDILNGSSGTTHVIADLGGYFGSDASGASLRYVPDGPTRIVDTRSGFGVNIQKFPLAPHQSVNAVGNYDYSCFDCPLERAWIMNVTETQAKAAGYLAVYPWIPAAPIRPTTSTLNFGVGQTVASLVSVVDPSGGNPLIYNGSSGTVQIVVDELGYYIGPS